MLFRVDVTAGKIIALVHGRQAAFLLVVLGRVVAVFLIDLQEAVEHDDGAGGAQHHVLGRAGDVDRHLIQHGAFHLAGQRTLPDQLIEPQFVTFQIAGHRVGRRCRSVGRMASWASWAFLAAVL